MHICPLLTYNTCHIPVEGWICDIYIITYTHSCIHMHTSELRVGEQFSLSHFVSLPQVLIAASVVRQQYFLSISMCVHGLLCIAVGNSSHAWHWYDIPCSVAGTQNLKQRNSAAAKQRCSAATALVSSQGHVLVDCHMLTRKLVSVGAGSPSIMWSPTLFLDRWKTHHQNLAMVPWLVPSVSVFSVL